MIITIIIIIIIIIFIIMITVGFNVSGVSKSP